MKLVPEHQVIHVPSVGLKLRRGSGSAVTSAAAKFVGVGVAMTVMRVRRARRRSLMRLVCAILNFLDVGLVGLLLKLGKEL